MINNLNFTPPTKPIGKSIGPQHILYQDYSTFIHIKRQNTQKISPQPFLIAGTFVFYSVKSSLLLLRSISESYHTVEVNLIEQLVGSTNTLYRKTVCRNLVTLDKS